MITTWVVTRGLNRELIPELSNDEYSTDIGDVVLKHKSKFEELRGNEQARVRVPMRITLGGPQYSSVQVGIEIEVSCSDNLEAIRGMADILHSEGLAFVHDQIHIAYEALMARLTDIHGPDHG